jgi:hypothetical protein
MKAEVLQEGHTSIPPFIEDDQSEKAKMVASVASCYEDMVLCRELWRATSCESDFGAVDTYTRSRIPQLHSDFAYSTSDTSGLVPFLRVPYTAPRLPRWCQGPYRHIVNGLIPSKQ